MGSRKGKLLAYFVHTPVIFICFEFQTVFCVTLQMYRFFEIQGIKSSRIYANQQQRQRAESPSLLLPIRISRGEMLSPGKLPVPLRELPVPLKEIAGSLKGIAGSLKEIAGFLKEIAGSLKGIAGSLKEICPV
ncbi:MAG: hypothetical protein LBK22_06410 [Tannerella sp.]|nr:hypothetical protein [Tannerella sp.]